MAAPVILLGPQRHDPTLDQAVAHVDRHLGSAGRLAVVTAGWEERELEIQELDAHVGGRTVNLEVYHRVEDVFRRDPELLAEMRRRHDTLRELQSYYRVRLDHALDATWELLRSEGTADLLDAARADAVAAVRQLDESHLRRVAEVHDEFADRVRPGERDAVVRHRRQIGALLADASVLCIAGGHVGVLLHRLRLFDILGMHADRPLIAWSAGAMVLGERVLLFHDSPPQGPGYAEMYDHGFGRCAGIVPLPHARHRLRLDERARVSLLARRLLPARPVALDYKSRVDRDGDGWRLGEGTVELRADGSVGQGAAA